MCELVSACELWFYDVDVWVCDIICQEERKLFLAAWDIIVNSRRRAAVQRLAYILTSLDYRSSMFSDHAAKGLEGPFNEKVAEHWSFSHVSDCHITLYPRFLQVVYAGSDNGSFTMLPLRSISGTAL